MLLITVTLKTFAGTDSLKTVSSVDVQKYAGKWFEIASMPNRFQKNCDCSTAEYAVRPDGKIDVVNSCNNNKKMKRDTVTGVASPVNSSNSHLKVKFKVFSGDYQIIALAPDYSYAMVATGDRKYLWILSRKKLLEEETIKKLVKQAQDQGFNTEKLNFTKQSCYNNY